MKWEPSASPARIAGSEAVVADTPLGFEPRSHKRAAVMRRFGAIAAQ